MRVLISGDIHGNLPALELLLKTEFSNYDLFVSHGDAVNYAPWSNECVDLLSTLPYKVLLQGNHELNYINGNYSGKNEVAIAFFDFCYPNFNRFESIKEYKSNFLVGDYNIQHTINDQYIFPDTEIGPTLETNQKNYIIGHSHHQFLIESTSGFKLYNTGSIGQNRKNLNIINYLIYDTDHKIVEMKSIHYDANIVINEMKLREYPEICLAYYQSKI